MVLKLYESSAGSGKTYTLVKEYIKLILRRRNFRDIIAISFTNQAANEMKSRIVFSLKELANSKNSTLLSDLKNDLPKLDIEEISKELLLSILHNYSDFKITTIDSFIYKIAKNFAIELNLPPFFELDLKEKIIAKKIEEILLSKLGDNTYLNNIFLDYLDYRINENIDINIKTLITNSISSISDQIFKENTFKILEDFNNFESNYDPNFNKKIKNKAIKIKEIIEAYPYKQDLKTTALKELEKIIKLEFTKVKIEKLEKSFWVKKGRETLFNIFWKKELEELIKDLISYYKKFNNNLSILLKNSLYQIFLIKELRKILINYIYLTNTVPNSIVNQRVSKIIQKDSTNFIYYKIGESYHNYLIDEFQDTSKLQWTNLFPLLENSSSEGFLNILVGDPKQSIYRWRGGDARIMTNSLEKNFVDFKKISLSNNYRSSFNIIEFNNIFFKNISKNIEITKNIYENSKQNVIKASDGYVEVNIFAKKEFSSLELKNRIAQNLLIKIFNLRSKGLNLKDMSILVRNNSEGIFLANYLISNGINVLSSESLLIHKNINIKLLLSILNYLINPNDNKNLSTLVILMELSLENYEVFSKLEIDKLDCIDEKIKFLSDNRERLLSYSLYSLVEILLDELPPLKDFENDLFLIRFLDCIIDSKTNNISDFLFWWEDIGESISISTPDNFDGVKIMTIHKSKGLQFKSVFIPFVTWDSNISKKSQIWLKNSQDKKQYILRNNKDLLKSSFKESYEEEEGLNLLDNINLIYVAFTRAVDYLFIYSYQGNKNRISNILYDNLFKEKEKIEFKEIKKDLVFSLGDFILDNS